MDKYIGKMLDNRYEILEVIGRGGMAVVYKAKCHRLNRFVAVKILKEELAQDEEFRQRFRDESQAVAMLSHPNIVSVYDVSRSGDVEYIVMELIDGITLKDYLERQSPLGWKETTFFALQIAKALEHAHSRGIIHRDIKPQNIMVLRDGTVKVADFGIARQAASTNTYNLREAIGSVHYVSPEQARGSHIDNRSDLYSLGVVMYEMLTGRLPFVGDTPLEVALQHINSVPLPPSDYVPNIPKTLEHIVMKAMAPVPADRYNNATELIQDIERFRNDPHYQVDVPRTAVPDSNLRDPGETQVIQYTSQLASAHPENNYLGIDITDKVLILAKRKIEAAYAEAGRPIDNVKIMSTDIERIKGVITPEDTVSRIYINFCNPWSKNASSNKHRLTYPRQLIQYRDFLKDGGEIYFKTDDDDLFRDSLTYFPASGYDIVWQTYDLHENEPEWNIRTEHEGMFTEMGIKIKALIARKKAGDDSVTWVEPKVLKKLAAQAEAEASAKAEGEGNV